MSLDGLLVVDKPIGPTSHDVVARVRRILKQPRIGHTGTLDPLASGVLPLVVGRATRLAQFLNVDAKRYDATIRLGLSTDTFDALGQPVGDRYTGAMPSRDRVEQALGAFRGTFTQQPPAYSAKKIEGRRSYRLARAQQSVLPAAVSVTVAELDLVDVTNDIIRLEVTCSSGFYVRSLAHDLGNALGVGAHLTALRRTAANGRSLADAVELAALERVNEGMERAQQALIPLIDVLPELPRLTLNVMGVRRACSGAAVRIADLSVHSEWPAEMLLPARARLLTESQELVGIADLTAAGLLHPVVVLM